MTTSRITRNLPKNPGPAGWSQLLPAAAAAKTLSGDLNVDWLIIGGGFAGLATARRLAQLSGGNERILLLEAERIGEGPAGRNSGFMIDLPHVLSSVDYAGSLSKDRAQLALNRRAIEFALDAGDEYGMDDEIICQSGKINGAATARGMTANIAYARHLDQLSEPYELLDVDQMQAICGTSYYRHGLYTPGTVVLHPAAYVRALADGLSQRVQIYENSPVLRMQHSHRIWRAQTADGVVCAPRVIMAMNGHIESFGFFRRRLIHLFLYASMSEALDIEAVRKLGGAPRWGVTPSDPIGTSVRRISGRYGDRIILRNQSTYANNMEVPDSLAARKMRRHKKSFAARFGMLEGTRMEFSWGGKLCLSLNDVPAFGEIEDGMFSACCQNGLGTARGTLTGILAADLASGNLRDNHQSIEAMLALAPPKKLPPEPLAKIGATLTLAWREWRAGREL